jgi:hypothetical protein
VGVVISWVAGRKGGPWAVLVRTVGSLLAALLFLGFFVAMHWPEAEATIVLAAVYPLVACEQGRALGRRTGLLIAIVALATGCCLQGASWRWGLETPDWVFAVVGVAFAGAPLAGFTIWLVRRKRSPRGPRGSGITRWRRT